MKKIVLSLLLSVGLTTTVLADTGPYAEFNLGYSGTGSANINKDTLNYEKIDSSHLGGNINVGLMFFGFGLEAGYIKYGDVSYSENGSTSTAGLSSVHLALRSVNSLGPLFIMGKLGVGQLSQDGFNAGQIKVDSMNGNGLFWGFGLGIKILPLMTIQAEYQQVQGNHALPTANLTSLGIGYTF